MLKLINGLTLASADEAYLIRFYKEIEADCLERAALQLERIARGERALAKQSGISATTKRIYVERAASFAAAAAMVRGATYAAEAESRIAATPSPVKLVVG